MPDAVLARCMKSLICSVRASGHSFCFFTSDSFWFCLFHFAKERLLWNAGLAAFQTGPLGALFHPRSAGERAGEGGGPAYCAFGGVYRTGAVHTPHAEFCVCVSLCSQAPSQNDSETRTHA